MFIKFYFKVRLLAFDKIYIDDFRMFTFFKTLHATAYTFNTKFVTLDKCYPAEKYTVFYS